VLLNLAVGEPICEARRRRPQITPSEGHDGHDAEVRRLELSASRLIIGQWTARSPSSVAPRRIGTISRLT